MTDSIRCVVALSVLFAVTFGVRTVAAQDSPRPPDASPSPASASPSPSPGSSLAPDDPRADARRLFELGLRLLDDNQYGEAAATLERSLALRQSPSALYNLGLAYRGMRRYGRAVETLERYLTLALHDDPMRVEAHQIITDLRNARAHVELRFAHPAEQTLLDGEPIPDASDAAVIDVDPGPHVLQTSLAGYLPVRTEVSLAPGQRVTVTLDPQEHPRPARLRVETAVPESEIRVDGQLVGTGSYHGRVDPGPHDLEVRARGHDTQIRRLVLAPGARERVVITLVDRPIYRTGWFLAGAAAAAVVAIGAVIVGGVVASQPNYDGGSFNVVVQGISR